MINCTNAFLGQSPKAIKIKTKVNNLTSFCTAKETIKKNENDLQNGRKIFADDAVDKGLISKIHQ